MAEGHPQRIWTRTFILLCVIITLAFAHTALLVPTISLYVTHLGGSALLVGVVLMCFSLPSFSLRPFVGYWADRWSAAGVLTLGVLLLAVGGALYLVPLLLLLILASVVRGLAWAGVNTGGYTLLAHIAPPDRRGEASGYYTGMQGSVQTFAPALALWLIDLPGGGFSAVFLVAVVCGLVGAALGQTLLRPSVHAAGQERRGDGPPPRLDVTTLLDRGVLLATGLQLCVNLALPAIAAFLPLYARELGIGNIGWFYVAGGVTGLVTRPALGRVSDRLGRGRSLAGGFLALIAGLALIVAAPNLWVLLAGAVLTTFGSAVNNTTATALAMDLADPARRGTAMATFSMAFQIGTGFGALLAGAVADAAGYRGMYFASILIAAAGLLLTAASRATLRHAAAHVRPAGVSLPR
jgi:MFS family permease